MMIPTLTRLEIAKYSELPALVGQPIKIGDEEIALFRLSNGEVKAIENKSPHPKGGILSDGLVSGHYVYCPLYDWKISLTDGNVQAPDEGHVKTYDIQLEEDKVFLLNRLC
ncbi:nitrite reductase small subunit NirD [Bacillus sp. V59.32b]|uniref:nitrite reductase small subunit NirD n=1 Tax=Bacillus sp. V59.32b TaxID=1758642 RepID=UPI0020B154DA|nr:nitrite reductase small subunit NirD [Bacillus sp. V59.32b]